MSADQAGVPFRFCPSVACTRSNGASKFSRVASERFERTSALLRIKAEQRDERWSHVGATDRDQCPFGIKSDAS